MKNLISLVTGGTSGVGKSVALALAAQGSQVIVAGRDLIKTNAVCEHITRATKNKSVFPMIADLSSRADIDTLVSNMYAQFPCLDILVNNAGSVFFQRRQSVDGIEMTFALNHLNYFLLGNFLIELLCKSPSPKILNVSSSAHKRSYIDFSDLQLKHNYRAWRAYGRSKLANLLFTYQMDRNLRGSKIAVNAVHPGLVATNFLASNNKSLIARFLNLFMRVGISSEESASKIMNILMSSEFQETRGKYFVNGMIEKSAPQSYSEKDAKQLWMLSNKLAGTDFPVRG
ncbi:MAG: short-chain dehydrogenase [Dehalococcoidia bacterium]|mgnify:FL=1|nr:short-chain dehydrogenase [Dehalococcoidia bacterium]|tara:strand:- start:393 stop:1250 length:858 start_codon:yes stop_codon:yes gene_type:complete